MDPSIVKLLEDDEDESMHSRADVEAFQAALNRDVGGDATASQHRYADEGRHSTFSQPLEQFPKGHPDVNQNEQSSSELEQKISTPQNEQTQSITLQEAGNPPLPQKLDERGSAQAQNSQIMDLQNSKLYTQQGLPRMPFPKSDSQHLKLQKISNQQAAVITQTSNSVNRGKHVSFALLLPVLEPQLDKDRAMQLQTLFAKLKKDEIPKEDFVRLMKNIVGDNLLRSAVMKVHSQSPRNQISATPNPVRMPAASASATQFADPHVFAQLQQRSMNLPTDPSNIPSPSIQLGSHALPSMAAGVNLKTPPKKTSIGQKKSLEGLSSPPPPSKKQKVSGSPMEQSIDQLNDVTAVSGVDLREEEEQLFSGSKDESQCSEASRRVVREEEDRLLLQKAPLHKKLAEIMSKCGLEKISDDVEKCLSLSVEERMRGLISNIIKLSKQRMDSEKTRHPTYITSDVRQQIQAMNLKAKEEWEKKEAEVAKLRKLNDTESNSGVGADKEKDDARYKPTKANKEDDDKMRTTAANVAARAAVGGDDKFSKWQLMAEQARQKREGGIDAASNYQASNDLGRNSLSTAAKISKDCNVADKRDGASLSGIGNTKKLGRNQVGTSQATVASKISIKDVIAVLERESHMSKTPLTYRLYHRIIPSEGKAN